MTAPLQATHRAVDPIAFGIAFFKPLGDDRAIGPTPWNNKMPMPYRWITVVSNPRRGYLTTPLIRVHTLAGGFPDAERNYTAAAREAIRTDNRAQVLVDHPAWGTTMPDGSIVCPVWAEVVESGHEEPYSAATVATRFVSEYRFAFKLAA